MEFPKLNKGNDIIKFDDGSQWYVIAEANTDFEAELIKGHLESANIEAECINNIDSAKLLTIGEDAVVRVYVNKDNYEKAKTILQEVSHFGNETIDDEDSKIVEKTKDVTEGDFDL